MTDPIELALEDLRHRDDVRAVALHGSRARSRARPDSDVDLLVVTDHGDTGQVVVNHGGLEVDRIERSAAAWTDRLCRDRPTWAWAWSDATVLLDRDGSGRDLAGAGRHRLSTYVAAPAHLAHLLAFWRHVRPKLAATVAQGDPVEIGWASTLSIPTLTESLFAINDVVEPASSDARTLPMLLALPRPVGVRAALRRVFGDPDPVVRAAEQLTLIDAVLAELTRVRTIEEGR